MKQHFNLLKPPTPKFIDGLFYLLAVLLTAISTPFLILIKDKKIKEALFEIFPKVLLKDIVINYRGALFIARKNKTDILLLNELSEPWAKYYFKPKRGDVFIDVGAHVGKYALSAVKLMGDYGKVIAIEAHPENFKALRQNIALNSFQNIIPVKCCAWNKDGEKLLLMGSRENGYSLKTKSSKEGNGLEVNTRTIDSILREYSIETVDWIKIDVEGAEVEVLEGMRSVIEKHPTLKIFVEVHGENKYEVDRILQGFRSRNLGGDNPNIPVIFYWKVEAV